MNKVLTSMPLHSQLKKLGWAKTAVFFHTHTQKVQRIWAWGFVRFILRTSILSLWQMPDSHSRSSMSISSASWKGDKGKKREGTGQEAWGTGRVLGGERGGEVGRGERKIWLIIIIKKTADLQFASSWRGDASPPLCPSSHRCLFIF